MKSICTLRCTVLTVLFLTVVAFLIRLPGLDSRPFHGDDGNQAYKTGILLETGEYVYDPHDHHGPTLYYLTLLPAWLAGQDSFASTKDWTYRIVPVFFGAGIILLTLLLRPGMSTGMLAVSGILVCLSPAFIFYSRYYIQEMLLVFFTLSAIGCGYRYLLKPSLAMALATGASLSLMHATKETAVIAYTAMVVGLIVVGYSARNDERFVSIRADIKRSHLVGAILVALAINVLLYTAFFSHARGPLDSILTYGNYLKRADGAGMHDKPWYYYLQLLMYSNKGPQYWFSEGFILLSGAIAMLSVFVQQFRSKNVPPLILFLSVYSLVMIVVYSSIPYKTPWTMLSFYHGIVLLSGYGFWKLFLVFKGLPAKVVCGILFCVGLGHLGYQSIIVNRDIPADVRNPYVYAHTSSAALKLVNRAHQLKAVHSDPENMVVLIIQPDGDYWPLPYYLRDFKQLGFYTSIPENPDIADMIIAEPLARALLSESLEGDYAHEMGGLRPSVLRDVYIKRELWDAYMETQE